MECFLLGEYKANKGPSNVNRSLIENSGGEILCVKSNNKILSILESFIQLAKCDKVVVSTVCAPRYYYFLRFLNKKYFYLMHGSLRFENEINRLQLSKKKLDNEDAILRHAERIICVSEGYAEWVKKRYPEYSDRITFVNNGVTIQPRKAVEKIPFTVAVAGGNRCIKNNLEVLKAVKLLHEQGIPCKLFVFGRKYPGNDPLEENEFCTYCGHLEKEQYYKKLDTISCFVMDSEVEPFGLVAADALNCHCSLLMTRNVGARSIMKAEPCDFIENPHDVREVAEKIKHAWEWPNSERLCHSIDREGCSEKATFVRLKKIIEGEIQ